MSGGKKWVYLFGELDEAEAYLQKYMQNNDLVTVEGVDAGTVLGTDIVSLAHALGGIVAFPEDREQRLVGRDPGVEGDAHMGETVKHRSRVRAVTPEQVAKAARDHLHPERAAIVLVGPAEQIRPQVEDLGPVEVVEP